MRTISVIIPTYNYGRYIAEAIASALAQTLTPLEVIVVDDGSTDNTANAVGVFADNVKYVWQDNAGVSAARNRGVSESHGDLIAFLDADDIWEPTKLERQMEKFDADGEIGLVHCGMREFDTETGETIALHLVGMEGEVADELLLWERPVIIGPGGTIMTSRKAFDNVGGFDTRMACGEDWDLCYRLARTYKVGFVSDPLVNYRSHPLAAHRSVMRMETGMQLFYDKAFANGGPEIESLRNRSLSNFHRIIAGSYFQARCYYKFVQHAAKSIWFRPSGIGYFVAYPLRRFRNGVKLDTAN